MSSQLDKPKLFYGRTYDFFMSDPVLSSAEKLILGEIGRFWPDSCTESNETIARKVGMSVSYVRNVISKLSKGKALRAKLGLPDRRAYITREVKTCSVGGKPHSTRILKLIVPGWAFVSQTEAPINIGDSPSDNDSKGITKASGGYHKGEQSQGTAGVIGMSQRQAPINTLVNLSNNILTGKNYLLHVGSSSDDEISQEDFDKL